MNLQHKKVRIPIAALGVTALIAGAGALASPAFADGVTITLSATSATTIAADPVSHPGLSYGLKLTGDTGTKPLRVEHLTGPGSLAVLRVPGNNASPTGAVGASTTLAADATASAVINVTSGTGIVAGDWATFASGTESRLVESVAGTAITLKTAVTATHAAGTAVVFEKPALTTTLTTVTAASNTSLHVASTAGVVVGDEVNFFNGTAETLTVTAVTDATHVAVTPAVAHVHSATSAVYFRSPWLKPAAATSTTVPNYVAGDRFYVGAATAGTYTFRFFKDENESTNYDAGDNTTPTFTLTVKDPTTTGVFDLSVPASVDEGTNKLKSTVTTSLTTSDIRGTAGSPAVGVLGTSIAGHLSHKFTNNVVTGAHPTGTLAGYSLFDGTNFYQWLTTGALGVDPIMQDTAPNVLDTQLQWMLGTAFPVTPKTTTVTSNNVDDLAVAVKTGQTADVTGTGVNVLVRSGVETVTYTARATGGTPTGLPGKTVVFTFDTAAFVGTALADLTANGAAIPSSGPDANKVSVITDSDGVATLIVKSAKTANTNAYKFTASSGAANMTGAPITATYRSAVATTFTTSGGAAAKVGGTVTLSGKILDQWLVGMATGGQVTLAVTRGGGIGTDISKGVDVMAGGVFSTTVADGSTTNTTPHTDAFTWTAPVTGTTTSSSNIYWVASVDVATAAFTGLGANTTFPVPATVHPTLATSAALTPINITGTLKDGATTPAVVPYAPFTLSGTDGVMFLDTEGKLSDTFTGMATASGLISDGTNAYVRVVFTKSGATTITLKSGTTATTTTGEFTTADPVEGWKITAVDAMSAPGTTIIVTGKVSDLFGNGVPNYNVKLDLGATTIGALGNTTPDTNSGGVWSTTFVSGSNQSGEVTLTATLNDPAATTNPLIGAVHTGTGFTVDAHGEYTDSATITVGSVELTLAAPAKLTSGAGGANAKLTGTGMPNSTVDVWAKPSGSVSYQLVDVATTDAEGDWGTTVLIKKSTYFLARSAGLSTLSKQTQLWSRVKVSAKALGGGKVSLYGNGDPNAKAPMVFYRSVAGVDPKLKGITTGSYGTARVTVKLPKGTRYVYATYQASGTGKGISPRIKIVVK